MVLQKWELNMLTGKIIAIFGLGAVLTGCAGDNPDNVPLYGNWEMTTKLGSISIDGRLIPPSAIPTGLSSIEGEDLQCGEPLFINREWQQADIDRRVEAKCTIEEYEVTPTRVTGSGKCEGVAPEANFNPRFALDIAQSAESYRLILRMEGDATFQGQPGRHVVRMSVVQEGVRKGDC